MNNIIDQISKTLMYKGPSPEEIVMNAIKNNLKVDVENNIDETSITVSSIIVYNVKITDKYVYDKESNLIKQTIIINGKENIVFDKFRDAFLLIEEIKAYEHLVA